MRRSPVTISPLSGCDINGVMVWCLACHTVFPLVTLTLILTLTLTLTLTLALTLIFPRRGRGRLCGLPSNCRVIGFGWGIQG